MELLLHRRNMLPIRQPETPQIKRSQAVDIVHSFKGEGKSEVCYCVVFVYDSARDLLQVKSPPAPVFIDEEYQHEDGKKRTRKKELPRREVKPPLQVRFKIPAYLEKKPDLNDRGEGSAAIPETWMQENPDFPGSKGIPNEIMNNKLEAIARKKFGG
jgi:hypothetical protein